MTLEEALAKQSRGALLICGYAPLDEDKAQCPRLLKSSIARFGASRYAYTAVLVDIDYEDHEVPPDNWHKGVLGKVASTDLPAPAWYRTPHGMRLVWQLEAAIPLKFADSANAMVHRKLNAAGIATDTGTTDWTRMFYGPFARGRDLPHGRLDDVPELAIDPANHEEAKPKSLGETTARDRPADLSETVKRAELQPVKSVNKQLADDLYRGALGAPVGKRHATLLKVALELSFIYESADPLKPYRLLYNSCVQMGKDPAELWRICEWSAAAFAGHLEETEEDRKRAMKQAREALDCDGEEIEQQLVLMQSPEYYVWDSTERTYSHAYTDKAQILAALKRHCPMLAMDPIWEAMQNRIILRDYSSPLRRVIYSYNADSAHYDKDYQELLMPTAKQDPELIPTYHEDVAGWLSALFGPHEQRGLNWLAAYPRLDRPVCALYVNGPNSIGKGLLAVGLARLHSRHGEFTKYGEIVNQFQSSFAHCPLVVADEKVPTDAFTKNDSSLFRQLVGNGTHSVNEKNRSEYTVLGYPRVLITANNEDALAIREDLNSEDLEAIKRRVGYIDRGADNAAEEYLVEMTADRGFENTHDLTESWADGRIAEHVLWLEENHEYKADQRFLVEGWSSDFTESLVTNVGRAGEIAETVIMAVAQDYNCPGIRWFDGKLFVNANGLISNWSNIRNNDFDKPPSPHSRTKALRSLANNSKKRLRRQGSMKRYWEIDATVLARLADSQNIMDPDSLIAATSRSKDKDKEHSNGGNAGTSNKIVEMG